MSFGVCCEPFVPQHAPPRIWAANSVGLASICPGHRAGRMTLLPGAVVICSQRTLPPRGHWGVPGGDAYGHRVEGSTRVEANVAVHTLVTIIWLDEK